MTAEPSRQAHVPALLAAAIGLGTCYGVSSRREAHGIAEGLGQVGDSLTLMVQGLIAGTVALAIAFVLLRALLMRDDAESFPAALSRTLGDDAPLLSLALGGAAGGMVAMAVIVFLVWPRTAAGRADPTSGAEALTGVLAGAGVGVFLAALAVPVLGILKLFGSRATRTPPRGSS